MKLTNLYNYGESKAMQTSNYCDLDDDPVISKIESNKEKSLWVIPS